MALIEKAAVRRDGRKAGTGFSQQRFRALDASLEQPLMGRAPGGPPEGLAEITCGKIALAREICDGRIAVQMGREKILDTPHLPRSESGAARPGRGIGAAIPRDDVLAKCEREVIDEQRTRQVGLLQDGLQCVRKPKQDRVAGAEILLHQSADAPPPLLIGEFFDRALGEIEPHRVERRVKPARRT
nr:hypothetical protein [Paraburkholderia silvatlantica]